MNVERPWTIYRTRFLVQARQLTAPLVFTDALGREHSGQPGDYLVESCEGLRCITPRAAFEDIYVPLNPSPNNSKRLQNAPQERPRKRCGSVLPPQPSPERRSGATWTS